MFPSLRTPTGPVADDAPFWNPQRASSMPSHRYRSVYDRVPVPEFERAWPTRRLETPPLWVPVDLRDGNQALADPMDPDRKRRFFDLLVTMGFKEIEVGYPSASRDDFAFVRHLVESDAIPDDVTIVVFTPARHDLIERTFASIEGLPRAVVHLYTATAPTWRDVVLRRGRDELHRLVLDAAALVARLAGDRPGVRFEFSPEVFNQTEPDYVLAVCDSLTELWDASPDRPVIHNLPATVEIASPNVYADQIEYMHRNLARRDAVILSVHPHNDRGTGVACAELAVLAGAQRVEGCLFGNGERTGNVDLVALALNLHAQGVDPRIDFSDIDVIRATVEHCNRIGVHERHPYGGDLVYTAFSGTHQDAINKGLAHHDEQARALGVAPDEAPWNVPYLPIDPHDVGRSYEAVIRVNSQSGKGGVAYVLKTEHGFDLPVRLRAEVSRRVQAAADDSGAEVSAKEIGDLFRAAYVDVAGPVAVVDAADGSVTVRIGDASHTGTADDPVAALVRALRAAGTDVEVTEHAVRAGVAYAECRVAGRTAWGAAPAPLTAVLNAVNRLLG
ncbi:2-isopropylmalate synthase [Actinomadura rayongensis]|uniref:2-isopropylmalate synthase n=1 Tax=Actinomadura rayongensis TaxID=1429076 RepID=A0A6I4WC02_9ACTN|nr:2-isopropylmalate synthase [Actinomadura rayongensis]MXQ66350.1 2-isopropylmalate synthase [Actinomadura rayongensis]